MRRRIHVPVLNSYLLHETASLNSDSEVPSGLRLLKGSNSV